MESESKNDTANPPHSRIQRVKGWFRKKSTKKAAQPGSLHTSDHDVPSRTESTAENGVDTLVFVADIVEKLANVINKAPLIAPVAALVSEVFKTVKEVKEIRGSRDTLHTELRDKMRDLGTAACQESSYKHSGERLREDLKVYRGLLEEASKLVSDFDARGSFKTSVQYPAWKRKFDDLEKKITSFEGRFILNRVTDIQTAQDDMRETAKIHALHNNLDKWLQYPPDMTRKQDGMQRLRHEDTGSWFLNGLKFGEWKANPGSLWITGNSGTGKSVLCSTVIREISAAIDGKPSAVAYFYFDFRDEKSQRPDIMLRSIVFQLSAQSSPPYKDLGRLHDELSGVPPRDEDLLKVLDEVLSALGRNYIIIDALDECNEADFHRLVAFIKSLLKGSTTRPLHFLFTSQPRQLFDEAFDGVPCVELQPGVTGGDIRRFVANEISCLKGWASQIEQVTDQVIDKSNGMSVFCCDLTWMGEFICMIFRFRLAACLLKELEDCWSTEWEETLNALPNDLYAIYDRFLERVPLKRLSYIQGIFRWILYSAHSMDLDELADAIAFDFSDPSKFVYDPRRRNDTSTIFKWLDGLITTRPIWRKRGGIQVALVVTLAHASVRDYILSKHFTNKFTPGRDFTERPSHTFIVQSCLRYLLHFANPDHPLNTKTLVNYPLSSYAARYWFHHLQHCDNRDALLDLTMGLLTDGSSQYAALNHLHGSISSPLYMCADIGYAEGIRFLLENGADVDAGAGTGHTPLYAATSGGLVHIVRLLLEKGADPSLCPISPSPLQVACREGHTDIVQMLLEYGAMPSMPDGEIGNALEAAVQEGHTEIIRMLLEHGTISRVPVGQVGNMLEVASELGHADDLRLLLQNGVSANAVGQNFGSALQAAARPLPDSLGPEGAVGFIARQTNVVLLLLDNGADINTVGGKYGGALQAACAGGIREIIQLILEKGADVNGKGGQYTPLQAAGEAGHLEIVRFLLEKGAEANGSGGKFGNALQAAGTALPPSFKADDITAFISRQTEMISLLIDNGADVNAMGGKYGTVLCAASSAGHHEIVSLLLDHGADMECGEFGSALQAAAGERLDAEIPLARRVMTMQVLLDKGANVDAAGGEHGTALQLASGQGYEDVEIVRLLLYKGANVDAAGGEHGTALQIASGWGSADVVKLLLDEGANVDAAGGEHGTALQIASGWGNTDKVKLLLDKGANVEGAGGNRGTALQLASGEGRKDVVELLLEKGAHVDANLGNLGSALYAASRGGYHDIVLSLLDHGADVNMEGGEFGSALQAAAGPLDLQLQEATDERVLRRRAKALARRTQIVRTLLERGANADEADTALQIASGWGHTAIVQVLLEKGATVDANSGDGTGLRIAFDRGKNEIVEMLREHGADLDAAGLKRNADGVVERA